MIREPHQGKANGQTAMLSGWILCALVVAGEAGGHVWFTARAGADLGTTYPSVLRWLPPGDRLVWRELPIDPAQVHGMTFDRGRRFQVSGEAGGDLDVLYLDFDAGHTSYHYDLLSHPPQYCMGMAGWEVVTVHPDRVVTAAGEPLRVQSLVVRSPDGTTAHVFKGIWIHSRFGFNGQISRQARIRLALQPLPAPPACIFVASVTGVADEAAAWDCFLRRGLDGFRQIPSASLKNSAVPARTAHL
jgi:hypothetical protein